MKKTADRQYGRCRQKRSTFTSNEFFAGITSRLFGKTLLPALFALPFVLTAAPRLYNAGFEKPGQGWKFSPEYSIAEHAGIDDSRALYVKRSEAAKNHGWAWQYVAIEGGKKYRISAQVKAEILRRGKYKVGAGFTLALRSGDGKIIKMLYPAGCIESTKGQWKTIEYPFTAPDDAATCELRVGLYSGFLGEAWFDNITVEEVE